MRRVSWLWMAVAIAVLPGCKKYKPEPTCQETLRVTERNGQRVLQAVNGLYLKEDFPVAACQSQPYSEDPYQRHFVAGGARQLVWMDHRLIHDDEYRALLEAGKWPPDIPYSLIAIGINFPTAEEIAQRQKVLPIPDWWYAPVIPHQRYPIDLLPNFGLDAPDPNAGVGPVKSKPKAYWAVRGTKDPMDGKPYTTFCSIKPPPSSPENDHSYDRNVAWLVQGETYLKEYIGNTCRGGVGADNGKPIGGRIDVPGVAVADIDKIYQAVSKYLSDLTVD